MRLVVALGGNALAGDDARDRSRRVAATAAELVALTAAGHEVVVTHGNGPQVGELLLDQDERRRRPSAADPLPLDVLVGLTQAQLGYRLQQAVAAVGGRDAPAIATVVTQVLVAAADPAFSRPTKPVGPRYVERPDDGAAYARGSGGRWRRVVPSPAPLEVVELAAIDALLARGVVPVCVGGGGVPVVREGGRLVGVEAVVDKDLASALLADRLDADGLLILTDVDAVEHHHGTPRAERIAVLTTGDAALLGPRLEEGSMGPKVAAAAAAARAGRQAWIGRLGEAATVLAGEAGTRVVHGEPSGVVGTAT